MGIGLGPRVKAARKRKAIDLNTMAERLHISPQELADIEDGNEMPLLDWQLVKAIRLAVLLDTNLSTLLGEEVLTYDEWALVLSGLVEYSANKPGLQMEDSIYLLIEKVKLISSLQKET